MTSTLFDLLVAAVKSPDDLFLRAVLCDRLEEDGYVAQRNVLHGLCPDCGGKLRRRKKDDGLVRSDIWWAGAHCRLCDRDDVMYSPNAITQLNRVVRELGCVMCPSIRHDIGWPKSSKWYQAEGCPRCGGRGLVLKAAKSTR